MKKLLSCLLLLSLCTWAPPALAQQGPVELPLVLSESRDGVFQVFQDLRKRLERAASKLARSGLSGPAAQQVLQELHLDSPHIVAAAITGPGGRPLAVDPPKYQPLETNTVAKLPHLRGILKSKNPAMSRVFSTNFGFAVVDARVPVLAPDGRLLGTVGALIKPQDMLAKVIDPKTVLAPEELWVMDRQGRILYDANPEEVGLNLFTSPLYQPYPDLRAMGETMVNHAQGLGFYKFLGKNMQRPVDKRCIWTSVGLFGTYWRLVYIDLTAMHSGWRRRDDSRVRLLQYDSAISDLSVDTQIIAACLQDNALAVRARLREFYFDYPGLYSVQWVDAKGVNRLGYPPASSLQDYNFNRHPGPTSRAFLKALKSDEAQTFEQPMLEGGTGIFHTVPVTNKGRVLGMLYYVIVKP